MSCRAGGYRLQEAGELGTGKGLVLENKTHDVRPQQGLHQDGWALDSGMIGSGAGKVSGCH